VPKEQWSLFRKITRATIKQEIPFSYTFNQLGRIIQFLNGVTIKAKVQIKESIKIKNQGNPLN